MKVIEFLGMPKAGKTTAIEVTESYLKKVGKRVRTVYEGARICPLDKEDRFMYNSWSFHNTINRILEARLDNYDFILVDRGVLDHLAFWKAIHPLCKDYNENKVYDYFSYFTKLEDFGFLFMLSPEEAIKREKKHNPFLGRVFDLDFLKTLHHAYESIASEFQYWNSGLIKINGSNPLETNLEKVLDTFKKLKKVVVWGKFDGLHQGQLEFLRHAGELGGELYVVVIPDEKAKENSGELPAKTAEARKRELTGLDFITDVYVDCLSNGLQSILTLRPDVFAFGHDQKTQWEEQLQQYLSSQGLHLEYTYLGMYNNGTHAKDLKCRAELPR